MRAVGLLCGGLRTAPHWSGLAPHRPRTGLPACASCHGVQGKGIPVQFPRLAGQHGDYIYSQLNLFRTGERANDGAKMMRTIAAKMTDADMKAVSAYIQGLR